MPTTTPVGSGGLMTRDVRSIKYQVLQDIPDNKLPKVGNTFSAWPWGDHFHMVSNGHVLELPRIKEWLKEGQIKVITLPIPEYLREKGIAA